MAALHILSHYRGVGRRGRAVSRDGQVGTVAGTAWQSGLLVGQLPGYLYALRDMIAIVNRTLLISSGLAVVKLVLP